MPRRHSILIAFTVTASFAIPFATRSAQGADVDRGRALYELRCSGCHNDSVHGRAKRVASSFEDVRRWASRWNATLGLRWNDEEIDDVAVHLNMTYYRYPCPPRVCKVVSLSQ